MTKSNKNEKTKRTAGRSERNLSEGWKQRQTSQNEQPSQIRQYSQDDHRGIDSKTLDRSQTSDRRSIRKIKSGFSSQTYSTDQNHTAIITGSEKTKKESLFCITRSRQGSVAIISNSLSSPPAQQQKKGGKRGKKKKKKKKMKKQQNMELKKSVQQKSCDCQLPNVNFPKKDDRPRSQKLFKNGCDDNEVYHSSFKGKVAPSISISPFNVEDRFEGKGTGCSPYFSEKLKHHNRPTNDSQRLGFTLNKHSEKRDQRPSVTKKLVLDSDLSSKTKNQAPIKGHAPENWKTENSKSGYQTRHYPQKNQNLQSRPCWNTTSSKNNWFARRMKKANEKSATCIEIPARQSDRCWDQLKLKNKSHPWLYPSSQKLENFVSNNIKSSTETKEQQSELRGSSQSTYLGKLNNSVGSKAKVLSQVRIKQNPWCSKVGAKVIYPRNRLQSDPNKWYQIAAARAQKNRLKFAEHLKLVNQRALPNQPVPAPCSAEESIRQKSLQRASKQQLKPSQHKQNTSYTEVQWALESAKSNSNMSLIQHSVIGANPFCNSLALDQSKEHSSSISSVFVPHTAKTMEPCVLSTIGNAQFPSPPAKNNRVLSERSSSRASEPDAPTVKFASKTTNFSNEEIKIGESFLKDRRDLSITSADYSIDLSNAALEVTPSPRPDEEQHEKTHRNSRLPHGLVKSATAHRQSFLASSMNVKSGRDDRKSASHSPDQTRQDRDLNEPLELTCSNEKNNTTNRKCEEFNQSLGIVSYSILQPASSKTKQERCDVANSRPSTVISARSSLQFTSEARHTNQQAQTPIRSRFPSSAVSNFSSDYNISKKQHTFRVFSEKRRFGIQAAGEILASRINQQSLDMSGLTNINNRSSDLLSRISKSVLNQKYNRINTCINGSKAETLRMNQLKILQSRYQPSSASNEWKNCSGRLTPRAGHRGGRLLHNNGDWKKKQHRNKETLKNMMFEKGRSKSIYESLAAKAKALQNGEKWNSSLYHQLMSIWGSTLYQRKRLETFDHLDAIEYGRLQNKSGPLNWNIPHSCNMNVKRTIQNSQRGAALPNPGYSNTCNQQIMYKSPNTQAQHTPYLVNPSKNLLPSFSYASPWFNHGETPPYSSVFMLKGTSPSSCKKKTCIQPTAPQVMSGVKDLNRNSYDVEQNPNPWQRHRKFSAPSPTVGLRNISQDNASNKSSSLAQGRNDKFGCAGEEDLPDEEIVIPCCLDGSIEVHTRIPANRFSAESSSASITKVSTSPQNNANMSASRLASSDDKAYAASFQPNRGKPITEAEYLNLIQLLSQYRKQQRMNESLIEQNTRLFAEVKRLLLANRRLKNCIWSQSRLPSPPPRGSDPSSSDAYSYNNLPPPSPKSQKSSDQVQQLTSIPTRKSEQPNLFSA